MTAETEVFEGLEGQTEKETKIFSTMRSANRAAYELEDEIAGDPYVGEQDDFLDKDGVYHPSSRVPYRADIEASDYNVGATIDVSEKEILGPDLAAGEADSSDGEEYDEDEEVEDDDEDQEEANDDEEQAEEEDAAKGSNAQQDAQPLKRATAVTESSVVWRARELHHQSPASLKFNCGRSLTASEMRISALRALKFGLPECGLQPPENDVKFSTRSFLYSIALSRFGGRGRRIAVRRG